MTTSSQSNMPTTPGAFVSNKRRIGSSTVHKAKPPLSPTSPVARRINPDLANSLVWSPTASHSGKPVDTEDCYWLVEEINEDDCNSNKTPATRRRRPGSLMIPLHERTRVNRDNKDIKGFSLQPRVEREDSALFGLEFLEDDH